MRELGISSAIMDDILKGKKTIEARLRTSKFVTIRKGDLLSLREDVWQDDAIVSSTPDKALVEVTKVLFFDSFDQMFAAINYKDLLPRASTPSAAMKTYKEFHSPSQEAEYGVVAIHFRLKRK